jgi:hypothetical protein
MACLRRVGDPGNQMAKETYEWRMRALTAERRLSVAAGGLLRLAQPNWDGKASGCETREMADYARELLDSLVETGDGEDVCALCGRRIDKVDRHFTDQGEPIHILCELTHGLAGW